jgi:hypothetical protein
VVAKRGSSRRRSSPRASRLALVRRAAPAPKPSGKKVTRSRRTPVARRTRAAAARGDIPPPFAGATAGASPRHLALFEVVRARVTLHGALQGLAPASGEQTVEPGRWTLRETLLHLVHSDRTFMAALEPALRGVLPYWADEMPAERDRRDDRGVEPLRSLDWGEALRRLHAARRELMEGLESLPEEPAALWEPDHPVARIIGAIARHDLFHADMIKTWRTARGV